jgi:hypothetical protein
MDAANLAMVQARKYIRTKGFRQIKFIDDNELLNYGNGICESVLKFFGHLPYGLPKDRQPTQAELNEYKARDHFRRSQWDRLRNPILSSLQITRSNRTCEARRCLERKLALVISYFLDTLLTHTTSFFTCSLYLDRLCS